MQQPPAGAPANFSCGCALRKNWHYPRLAYAACGKQTKHNNTMPAFATVPPSLADLPRDVLQLVMRDVDTAAAAAAASKATAAAMEMIMTPHDMYVAFRLAECIRTVCDGMLASPAAPEYVTAEYARHLTALSASLEYESMRSVWSAEACSCSSSRTRASLPAPSARVIIYSAWALMMLLPTAGVMRNCNDLVAGVAGTDRAYVRFCSREATGACLRLPDQHGLPHEAVFRIAQAVYAAGEREDAAAIASCADPHIARLVLIMATAVHAVLSVHTWQPQN